MPASAPPENLQVLGELLQKRLRLIIPQAVWKVRCALKKGILMILVEHQEGAGIDTTAAFTSLRQALTIQLGSKEQEVRLFLRVAQQDIPYAQDFYTYKPVSEPFKDTETRKYAANNQDMLAPQSLDAWEQVDLSEGKYPSNPGFESTPATLEEEVEVFEPLAERENKPANNKIKPLLFGGGIFAVIASVIGGYMLTRPCVMGACEALDNAQQVYTQATKQLRNTTEIPQLSAIQQKLQTANQDLTAIPAWSPRHSQAQETQSQLIAESEKIAQVLTALQKASQAQASSTTNAPQTWVAKQTLWRQAIAPLEAIPPKSELYQLAQLKLPSYRASLISTNQKLQTEQEFNRKITEAKSAAAVATTQEKEAKTLADWEKTTANWQVAINTLNAIPRTSSASSEAQQLLTSYQPQFMAARDRTNQEKLAFTAYNHALDIAKLAQRYEQQNQIPQGVTSWSQALSAAGQVPKNTIYYNQAQSLLPSYTNALQKAEGKLKVANVLQLARTDLNRTCNNGMRICTFIVSEQGISVRLTPEYERALLQMRRDVTASPSHLQMLQQALGAISGNVGLPLVLADSRGSLLGPGG